MICYLFTLKKRNKHINLNYEVINKQIKDIKKFLNLEEDEKTIKNFFLKLLVLKKIHTATPTHLKNIQIYSNYHKN